MSNSYPHLSGSHLDGDRIVGETANTKEALRENANHLGVEIRPGDYDQRSVLEQSLRSMDVVVLVSGMDAPEKRIEQHRNVIAAAQSAGVGKIVYISVQGAAEGTPGCWPTTNTTVAPTTCTARRSPNTSLPSTSIVHSAPI